MRETPRPNRAAMLTAIPLVLLTGLYLYAGRIDGTPSSAPQRSTTIHECGQDMARRTAWFVAQDHLRKRLASDPSIKLEGLDETIRHPADRVEVIGAGRFRVEGWITTSQATSAKRQLLCELTRNDDGTWTCDRLEIIQMF
jgi:hypothetical protein